jgi:IS30 family transposase
MRTQPFNATEELNHLRQYRQICHKKIYRHSRLDKFRAELVQLQKAGASYRELALWLRQKKRMRISHTTIARYLKKLPEMQQGEIHHAALSSS